MIASITRVNVLSRRKATVNTSIEPVEVFMVCDDKRREKRGGCERKEEVENRWKYYIFVKPDNERIGNVEQLSTREF